MTTTICQKCENSSNDNLTYWNKPICYTCRKRIADEKRSRDLQKKREYTKIHKEKKVEYDLIYRSENKEKIAKYKKQWEKKRKDEPNFKILRNVRRRILHVIKDNYRSQHTHELLGCTTDEFKIYLESLWKPGMTWENYGFYGWHIDHIIPCRFFDFSVPEELAKCFHYTNMRPLWAKENLSRPRNIKDY